MKLLSLPSLILSLLCMATALHAQQPGVAISTSGAAPHSSAMLDVQSTTKGFLLPRMTQTQRNAIINPTDGLMVFDTDAQRLYQYQDGIWRSFIDNSYWTKSALRRWVYNGVDSIGIGIGTPGARLHVNNGDLRVSNADINIVNGDIVHNKAGATIQLQDAAVNKGFLQISGDDLRLGTNAGNSTGNVYVRMNGTNRFQFAESGRMTILADQSPTLYFNTGGINKGYLQLFGENLKLDAPGNSVLIGDDMIVDDATNRIGIGTTTPEQKLHITGNVKVNTGKVLNADNFNMLPVAYGLVKGSQVGAPVLNGTSNLSASRTADANDNKEIRIKVSGVDLTNAIIQLTSVYSRNFVSANTSSLNADGSVTVTVWSMILDETSYSDFHIVVYIP